MNNKFLMNAKRDNLRACQLKQLSMLEEIARICDKHHINYWLDGGTLLGAVRHGGFIPWDDDIDIGMSKDDLKKFIIIASKELPSHLFLQTPQSDPSYKSHIVKIRDLNSLCIEPEDDFSKPYQKGLFIDIFPFINYPSISKSWTKRLCKGYWVCNYILNKQHYYSIKSFAELLYFSIKIFIIKVLWNIICIFTKKDTYISNILPNNVYGINHRIDSIYPISEISFEGKKFKAPANPDAYLKDLYHDYLRIPPKEKQKSHAIYINSNLNKS